MKTKHTKIFSSVSTSKVALYLLVAAMLIGITASSFGQFSRSRTTASWYVDSDGDGLTNRTESQIGTDPNRMDTDYDGLTDGEEFENGLNPNGSGQPAYYTDTDGDRLSDWLEVKVFKSDPTDKDSDSDGIPDPFDLSVNELVTAATETTAFYYVFVECSLVIWESNYHYYEDPSVDYWMGRFFTNDFWSPVVQKLSAWNPDANTDHAAYFDSDGDGQSWLLELFYDTDPENALEDLDGDGILNSQEMFSGGHKGINVPDLWLDTDGDNIADANDLDDDGDGIATSLEGTGDSNGNGIPAYLDQEETTSAYFDYGSQLTADAGDDIIARANEAVTLVPGVSSGPNAIVSFKWTRLADDLIYQESPTPSFTTTTMNMGWMEEVWELEVTDEAGNTATDTVSIINRDWAEALVLMGEAADAIDNDFLLKSAIESYLERMMLGENPGL